MRRPCQDVRDGLALIQAAQNGRIGLMEVGIDQNDAHGVARQGHGQVHGDRGRPDTTFATCHGNLPRCQTLRWRWLAGRPHDKLPKGVCLIVHRPRFLI